MQPWFIWNNRNSYAEGLWISKLPPIIRAPERYDEIQVPGRAGSLIMLEDDEDAIYDRYEKEVTVTAPNTLALQRILDWLSGSGEVIFSNESDKVYKGRIVSDVKFSRIDNTMVQAKVRFYVEPFKYERYPAKSKATLTANGTIYNPGSVSSRPLVKITKSSAASDLTVTIGTMAMVFKSFTGTITVDCDANIITSGTSIWTGKFTGDFWKIPVGSVNVTRSAACTIEIEPRWRWK